MDHRWSIASVDKRIPPRIISVVVSCELDVVEEIVGRGNGGCGDGGGRKGIHAVLDTDVLPAGILLWWTWLLSARGMTCGDMLSVGLG